MTDFKIQRGLSSQILVSPGVPNPKLIIEDGCWYLCEDTAELYLGIEENGELVLKQINGSHTGTGEAVDPEVLSALEAEINTIKKDLGNYAKSADVTTEINTAIQGIELPEVPSKTSQLTNDSGFLTAQDINDKADISHKHDDLYDAKGAAEAVKNELLNGAGDAFNTLKELGDLINTNQGAIDTLNTIAAGKADIEHSHSDYVTGTELDNKGFLIESDLAEYAKTASLPTNTSQLTNDSGYITAADVTTSLGDYALRSELDSKSDKDHTHDGVYAPVGHNHEEYLTSTSLSGYALTTDLAAKADVVHTHTGYADVNHSHTEYAEADHTHADLYDAKGTATSMLTEAKSYADSLAGNYAAVDHDHNDYAAATHDHNDVYAVVDHTHDSYLTEDALNDYATKQFVSDAIETHEGIAKKAEVAEVKTVLETTVIPVVTEVIPLKADEVPFTESTIVKTSVGGFVAGEDDIKGWTIAKIFAKLLGIPDEDPGENPDEPDEPDVPEEFKSLAEKIEKTRQPMYSISQNGELLAVPFALVNRDEEPTESGFYVVKDSEGNIIDAGYQDLQIKDEGMFYIIALPKELDFNTMVDVQSYGPDEHVWVDSDIALTSDPDTVAACCNEAGVDISHIDTDQYTIWVQEDLCTGSILRYRIIEEN